MIRITGGINRSRLLVTPDGEQTKPTMTYDTAKYHNMKNLSDKVTKSINIIEQARPFKINVCRIIQNFLAVKPENVAIDNIQIRPERYILKGSANTVEQANEFSQAIVFGQDRLVNLSDVKSKDNKVYWEIHVTTKDEGKKGGKKN